MILINMEMPPNCSECAFCGYYGYGAHMCDIIEKAVEYESAKTSRRDDCPLIPVPEHGRLIDADEFLERAIGTKCFRGDYALMLEELVGESTTIIPADKEGE